ncbi:mucin-associated surface protein (MASP) [Trypanosoma cruzi Dm28c]|uniref:Mucin-associated surface protein (MASP) n=2 Tax=Trypanosoma cruzi TaxID=5693 RepID=V5B5Y4_TRYCR|nr:mucin-associated surface protein (MASP) [Trypanosoma cruzi Dm28c]PBJ78709.1 mucin-associated surface protein [Trypanosoma cruzi cruzi]PWV01097.1 Mucin-associated surface protein (MASP) [Trypanosoma cruzi]
MAMMTGRVLLVCALCVLWCGAGGRCDEVVVRAPAGGAVDESEPLVQSKELGISSQGSQELDDGAPVVKREAPPAPPTPSDGDDDDDGKGEGDGQEDGSPSELEEPVKDAPDQGKTKSTLQNKEQEIRQPPQSQVNVQQQPQPPPQQPQPQLQPQPNTSASEKSEGVGENSRGGAVQSSLGVEDKGNEDPKNPKEEDSLKSPGEESESSEQVQTTVQKTVPPEHKTQNEVLTPEQKTNESQSTDTSTNLPEPQKENKEYPASMEGTAQSTSTGSQEQEAEPSTSEEPSPFEEEQSTGTKTTEDARTPDAAVTEKRQTATNNTTTPGDIDGSTAVSHTTSPLLLLLVVACAAAAVVTA